MKNLLKEAVWQNLSSETLPVHLQAWIPYSGSFVERLKSRGVDKPEINVLKQRWRMPTAEEADCLQLSPRSFILAREVLILSEAKKWMYARTIFPAKTLTGELRQLAHLKSKSLGSVLFKDPSMMRSAFEVAQLTSEMTEFKSIVSCAQISAHELWARRSCFTIQEKSLLLTEVFLPDIESLC